MDKLMHPSLVPAWAFTKMWSESVVNATSGISACTNV
jgi:hypothetical protein